MLCDIIIPVWNQLNFTKGCVDSIIEYTDIDHRIIIVDNGSAEKTRLYLEGLSAIKKPPVSLIRNEANLGFIKAVNLGIKASSASAVCIINNDTLVTKGWLKEMLNILNTAADIGIVNPSSNSLGQRPAKGEPLELYAEKFSRETGRFADLGAAIGFCMLIKKEVIERIGLFDEVYGMGNFEDTDFSRRAIKEGYRCVRACGAYVYHRESASFNKLKTYEDDFNRNKEIYEFRWGKPRRIAYVMDSYDDNILRRLKSESVRLAREGNWIWYFSKEHLDLPAHSNIIPAEFHSGKFYLKMLLRILTKKKKFDEIFVGGESFGKILERLSFIHKAKIRYY